MTFYLTGTPFECPVVGCLGECKKTTHYWSEMSRLSELQDLYDSLEKADDAVAAKHNEARRERIAKNDKEVAALKSKLDAENIEMIKKEDEERDTSREAYMKAYRELNRFKRMIGERDDMVKALFIRNANYEVSLKQANEFILGKYGEEID